MKGEAWQAEWRAAAAPLAQFSLFLMSFISVTVREYKKIDVTKTVSPTG